MNFMSNSNWKAIERSKPPVNKLVELWCKPASIGAPECQYKGWKSIGRMRESGVFSIKQNESKTVDFNSPTHWRELAL